MRNAAILTPFLLFQIFFIYTQSIAQTSTISGTVYEKEQSKTSFTAPQGKIIVYLPDDIKSGDVISGTVVAEPSGKNEKEQKKNLNKLLKYKLYLPTGVPCQMPSGNDLVLQNGRVLLSNMSFAVPVGKSPTFEMKTSDNKTISTAQIPTLPTLSTVPVSSQVYTLTKKVIADNESLVVLQSVVSGGVPKLILHNTNKATENYVLESTTHSPRKLVYDLPENLSGMYEVCVQTEDKKTKKIDLVNIVAIKASIGKGNLLKGEKTQLTVQVSGLQGCPYRPVQLELSNQTTSVIQLEKGNQQLFPIDQFDAPEAFVKNESYRTIQNVIGQTTGNFSINTALHIPPSAYSNTAQAYFNNIKGAEEFNESANALKKDINRYVSDALADTKTATYLKQVSNNFPTNVSADNIGQAKSKIINMLNPVSNMPGGKTFFRQLVELNKLHPDVAVQMNIPQFVHPLHDLAGEFNSTIKKLTVNAADQQSLLHYLGAMLNDNGTYTFNLSDGAKQVVYTHVTIEPRDPVNAECGTPSDVVKEEPATDTAKKTELEWPDNMTPFKDTSGRDYRFYKNAECKLLYSINAGNCKPEVEYIYDKVTGKYEGSKPTGRYVKSTYVDTKMCLKGTGYCTEMWQVGSVHMIYDDKECKNLIDVKKYERFQCL